MRALDRQHLGSPLRGAGERRLGLARARLRAGRPGRPGTARSKSDMASQDTAAGPDVYDTVESIAAQKWSTGKVAMVANSQLAMVQWPATAQRPPYLTAIDPWEGLTDVYRDVVVHGGIPDTVFHTGTSLLSPTEPAGSTTSPR
ncbi:CocE/NonD family hydrolase [Streptomyces sp. NPDC013978]|uniref:CocE/NonD family hydrolase n=1 Tax=Streptomyces sp. NPDC013978 TaxID=3364869 RepID=UPI0036F8A8CE